MNSKLIITALIFLNKYIDLFRELIYELDRKNFEKEVINMWNELIQDLLATPQQES